MREQVSLTAQNIIRCCSTPSHIPMSLIISVQDGITWAQKIPCTPPLTSVLPSKQFSSLIGRRGVHPHLRKDITKTGVDLGLGQQLHLTLVCFVHQIPLFCRGVHPHQRKDINKTVVGLRPAVTLDIGLFCTPDPTVLYTRSH